MRASLASSRKLLEVASRIPENDILALTGVPFCHRILVGSFNSFQTLTPNLCLAGVGTQTLDYCKISLSMVLNMVLNGRYFNVLYHSWGITLFFMMKSILLALSKLWQAGSLERCIFLVLVSCSVFLSDICLLNVEVAFLYQILSYTSSTSSLRKACTLLNEICGDFIV